MQDRIVVTAALDGGFSLVAGVTTTLVEQARIRHDLSPTAGAALGRLLTGAALLGATLKGKERITLQIASEGPLRGLVAEAWLATPETIAVRGYARFPRVDVPLNARGKFDVGGAVGAGRLQVTRSFEIGQPYVGIVPLVSGEIADDLATYLRDSQQIPSVVALGVLENPGGVLGAGGTIAQLLPSASEATIDLLERQALAMPPVAGTVADGGTATDVAHTLSGSIPLKPFTSFDVVFRCRCSRERVEIALLALGRDELRKMRDAREIPEATCEYCGDVYYFSGEEIDALARRTEARRLEG